MAIEAMGGGGGEVSKEEGTRAIPAELRARISRRDRVALWENLRLPLF